MLRTGVLSIEKNKVAVKNPGPKRLCQRARLWVKPIGHSLPWTETTSKSKSNRKSGCSRKLLEHIAGQPCQVIPLINRFSGVVLNAGS